MFSNSPKTNNTKCQNSPPRILINPSILWNLIRNGFGSVEVSYEMFSFDLSFNKMLSKLKTSNYIIKIITRAIFNIVFLILLIFYADIHLRKPADNVCYFQEK